jgi:dTDP-4-amino-4,6-dideoxygalactose transaminase
MSSIPLVDLQAAHAEVPRRSPSASSASSPRPPFIGGEEVAAFEREYAAFSGVASLRGHGQRHGRARAALRAAGVGHGDEVILPANTFIATRGGGGAARRPAGAGRHRPGHVPHRRRRPRWTRSRPRTRAVVPVHLYGQQAPIERIAAGLAGSDVVIVEDAAQCQGANPARAGGRCRQHRLDELLPGQEPGAYGDAGAVLTNDADLATTVRTLGQPRAA